MSDTSSHPSGTQPTTPEDRPQALFAGMVLQQANLAMTCLGKMPRPDSGQPAVDLEAASLFIDTLDMLETRTRGNLSAAEARLLRETLTSLRIAFVETADAAARPGTSPASAPAAGAPPASATPPSGVEPGVGGDTAAEADARVKFVKRY